jgi:hypothetical protein
VRSGFVISQRLLTALLKLILGTGNICRKTVTHDNSEVHALSGIIDTLGNLSGKFQLFSQDLVRIILTNSNGTEKRELGLEPSIYDIGFMGAN